MNVNNFEDGGRQYRRNQIAALKAVIGSMEENSMNRVYLEELEAELLKQNPELQIPSWEPYKYDGYTLLVTEIEETRGTFFPPAEMKPVSAISPCYRLTIRVYRYSKEFYALSGFVYVDNRGDWDELALRLRNTRANLIGLLHQLIPN